MVARALEIGETRLGQKVRNRSCLTWLRGTINKTKNFRRNQKVNRLGWEWSAASGVCLEPMGTPRALLTI